MSKKSPRNQTLPRPRIPNEDDNNIIQSIIDQDYASIPSDLSREDDNTFSLCTLQWIKNNESVRFNSMDFTHV